MHRKIGGLISGIVGAIVVSSVLVGFIVGATSTDNIMRVENTSGTAGETNHVIYITGNWTESLGGYQIGMHYNATKITIASISLKDTVAGYEGSGWQIVGSNINPSGYITAGAATYGNNLSSGSGNLFKLIVNINASASDGTTTLDLANDASYFFHAGDGATIVPDSVVDGGLTIGQGGGNNPPNVPSILSPANHASNVPITTSLSWTGGDPDQYDTVTYDVYFGTSSSPPKMVSNQLGTIYNPGGTLAYSTQYYWKIVAWDNHGAPTVGPVWYFITKSSGGGDGGDGNQNTPPIADADGPYTGYVNNTIMFDGRASRDPGGTIAGYRWDFTNDGTWDTTWLTEGTIAHAYQIAGNYTVQLQVKDNEDATATDTAQVTVLPLEEGKVPPVADPDGPYTGVVDQAITFDGSGSSDADGTITIYTWDFGDGTTGYGMHPLHGYTTNGTYTVMLTVTDNDSLINTARTTADISSKTIAIEVTINGITHYLIDTNGDGTPDLFHNTTRGTNTSLTIDDNHNYLIDDDGDGTYDYRYNPAQGTLTPWNEEGSAKGELPWTIIIVLVVIVIVIIGVVVFLYRQGYL